MRIFKLNFIFLVFVFALFSCGGSQKSTEEEQNVEDTKFYFMEPQTTSISGPLGKAFSIVKKKYKANKEDLSPKIYVEIELTDASQLPEGFERLVGTRENKKDPKYPMLANFIIEFLDEDEDIIESKDESYGVGQILRMSEGEKGSVYFYLPYKKEGDVKFFRIKSDYYPNDINNENISESNGETGNDEEFDKAMKHTKEAVETTTEMMKNIQNMIK